MAEGVSTAAVAVAMVTATADEVVDEGGYMADEAMSEDTSTADEAVTEGTHGK